MAQEEKKDQEEKAPTSESGAAPPPPPPPDDIPLASDGASASEDKPQLVIGIGASAGGLEALGEFFTRMPGDSGMAFVVVMHLDPTHESHLDDLLQKYTGMEVLRIEDNIKLAPNKVYVIPPNQDLGLLQGRLQLLKKLPQEKERRQMAIDGFFRHLADDQGDQAACIILSGSGADGTLGLKAIKEKGGLGIVQNPETANYSGMPRQAIETGLADYILAPAEMPQALLSYSRQISLVNMEIKLDERSMEALNKIFLLLRAETNQDFSQYRVNTLFRRITKRMSIHKIENIHNYTYFLRQNPQEITKLFYDILIGVTQFFREPEAFESLRTRALPHLFDGRTKEQPLRVWVPGCSTGEEAYSLAIMIHDYKQEWFPGLKADIFATDINPLVIEKARQGQYPASIIADVPEAYLRRYFSKYNHSYGIKQEIREMLIFAEQSVLKDPPFSRLDLISCRNLLIYLKPETQRKVLSLFQYALRPGGILFLGSSENVGEFTDFFTPLDRKWRLFRRTAAQAVPLADVDVFSSPLPNVFPTTTYKDIPKVQSRGDYHHLTEEMLLDHYNPVGVLINEKQEILYTYGNVDHYFKIVAGEARLNLIDMARTGLELELDSAIHQASIEERVVVRRGIWVKKNGSEGIIDLTVKPVSNFPQRTLLLIIIEETGSKPGGVVEETAVMPAAAPDDDRVMQLSRELEATKKHRQSMIEELQIVNEEHRSFAEELQSANEELQSTNEELTTSQEELQSVNEELVTANSEIQNKNIELRQANNDLYNLLASTDIATIFLDTKLNIKRFTPAATGIINLISSDIGRPLRHTVSNLKYDHLIRDIERVLDTLNTHEEEVQTEEARWYNMRILPYRTVENVIEGVVLTFAEITNQKRVEAELRRVNEEVRAARDYARTILDVLQEGVIILDKELRVISGNRAFYEQFGLTPEVVEGQQLYNLKDLDWDTRQIKQFLEKVIAGDHSFEQIELQHEISRRGRRRLRLHARWVNLSLDEQAKKILLKVEDITDQNS